MATDTTSQERCGVTTQRGRGPLCSRSARYVARGPGIRGGAVNVCSQHSRYFTERLWSSALTSVDPLGAEETPIARPQA